VNFFTFFTSPGIFFRAIWSFCVIFTADFILICTLQERNSRSFSLIWCENPYCLSSIRGPSCSEVDPPMMIVLYGKKLAPVLSALHVPPLQISTGARSAEALPAFRLRRPLPDFSVIKPCLSLDVNPLHEPNPPPN